MNDSRPADYAALIMRVTMGLLFLFHGGTKLFVIGPAGTMAMFENHIGLPGWFGLFIIALEMVGGICLIIGFNVRLASILLAGDLIGAIALVHIHHGFSASAGGVEYVGFWTIALISQVLLGNGALAVRGDVVAAVLGRETLAHAR
jgi:putative oxidoreductase